MTVPDALAALRELVRTYKAGPGHYAAFQKALANAETIALSTREPPNAIRMSAHNVAAEICMRWLLHKEIAADIEAAIIARAALTRDQGEVAQCPEICETHNGTLHCILRQGHDGECMVRLIAAGAYIREATLAERARHAPSEGEVAALREDAERYRWLRDGENPSLGLHRADLIYLQHKHGAELDAAIDAARQLKPPEWKT